MYALENVVDNDFIVILNKRPFDGRPKVSSVEGFEYIALIFNSYFGKLPFLIT